MSAPYKLYGALGSPYSIKMRALLRYRRLAHVWYQSNDSVAPVLSKVKVPVIPVLAYPDGSLHNDSTPVIFDLENHHKQRSVLPEEPAMAFLAFLLEDMADEWGTKMMFHYRWYYKQDETQVAQWLSYDRNMLTGVGAEAIKAQALQFAERQKGRMAIVGCTEQNKPLIEDTMKLLLTFLEDCVPREAFLFGTRPSLADFAWMGQLFQLASDPTPANLMRTKAPYTYRWVMQMDDMSGVEGNWRQSDAPLPAGLKGLLKLAGDVYLPFLLANAQAFAKGEKVFSFSALGKSYTQGVFKYQVKCLHTLRQHFAQLSQKDKDALAPVLREANCWQALQTPPQP